jgi:hypothetical protein
MIISLFVHHIFDILPHFNHPQDGRTPLHFAAAIAGNVLPGAVTPVMDIVEERTRNTGPSPASATSCYDLLLDFGASETMVDHEGYSPASYHRSPQLVDMLQVRGLNQCEFWKKKVFFGSFSGSECFIAIKIQHFPFQNK